MSRPRVVLVKPPEASAFSFGAFSLGVLAAFVRDICEPVILDATADTPAGAAAHICSLNPDIVGITAMGFGSVPAALRLVRSLKRRVRADKPLILAGGHGARSAPLQLLEAGASGVVIGEGELPLRTIIEQGVVPGAPGTVCLVGRSAIAGPALPLIRPLDRLPSPARDLMPPPHDGIHLLETSRGCPHSCAFCETSQFHGNTWRPFSPVRVASEMARLVKEHSAWTILLADDNFAASPTRVIEICKRLSRALQPAVILASARADDLCRDPAVIPSMARARILRVTVGVETLEHDAAVMAGKPIHRDVYRETFARLRAHGIFSVASFIAGLPGQRGDAEGLVDLAVDAGPDAAIFVPFIAIPGTKLAAGRDEFASKAADKASAVEMTAAYYRRPEVRRRLEEAEAAGGIRGLMARATLAQRSTTMT